MSKSILRNIAFQHFGLLFYLVSDGRFAKRLYMRSPPWPAHFNPYTPGAVCVNSVSGLSLTSTDNLALIVFWGVWPALCRYPDCRAISVISV